MRTTKTVGHYAFGRGALNQLDAVLSPRRADKGVVYFIDHFFQGGDLEGRLPIQGGDRILYVDTTDEPTTDGIDAFTAVVVNGGGADAVVGIGGGSVLDTAKAVSNLLGNPGQAEDYQGWDLLANPGVFKVGVPTLSGTGAEGSRTCVMMNHVKNLKLGMNSDHTVFDRLILDPDLTATVPREQFFFTGMDTYIHCIESLRGSYRHAVADAYSRESLNLCRDVFLSDDMMTSDNREKLMVASYMGGSAIGNSFVGVVHPLSAGLSMVFHSHHCVANCMVMNVMEDFYPEETNEFRAMCDAQDISVPKDLCSEADDSQIDQLIAATVVHEKPLINALGAEFRSILTDDRLASLFKRM